jgi:hypothetical protein
MAKKVVKHKTTSPRKKTVKKTKGVIHYLLVYSMTVIMAVTFYLGGYFFITPNAPCANSKSCQSDLSMHIDNNAVGYFDGRKVIPPAIDLSDDKKVHAVLGTSENAADKHIYIDLSTQKLYAYEKDKQIFETFIASGKWNPTPVGNFHIWEKLRATRMKGGEGADAYDLPNVPYVMYFYQDYGLHGAYWHDNFGHMMSHGCVNMRAVDAQTVYEWADGPSGNTPGTAVSVCNSFTGPNTCVQKNPIN